MKAIILITALFYSVSYANQIIEPGAYIESGLETNKRPVTTEDYLENPLCFQGEAYIAAGQIYEALHNESELSNIYVYYRWEIEAIFFEYTLNSCLESQHPSECQNLHYLYSCKKEQKHQTLNTIL